MSKATNNVKCEETMRRAVFFQKTHVWPLSTSFNYNGWLENFTNSDDFNLACLILDFFSYYPAIMIDKMLETSVGKAGHFLCTRIPDWTHSYFKERCLYSFIPGEDPNPADSGNYFARKLRDALGIPERQIIDYGRIPQSIEENDKNTPIILVDDFVGSGAQVDKAWNENRFLYNNKTLKEMSEEDGYIFAYAPLIMNYIGEKRISERCPTLFLSAAHILGPEYNLFNSNCICWKENQNLFASGIELILRKSKELNIPFTNGIRTTDAKGFVEQGLALAFEHGAPDAILPIFYWCDNWTPLIKKRYDR